MFSLKQGRELVKLARKAVETYIKEKKVISPKGYDKEFDKKYGVFTTIESYPSRDLRGCIGYPRAGRPLIEAVVSSAISAAMSDPRFKHLKESELENVTFEVSILTQPKELKCDPEKRAEKVEVGRHGLIIEYGPFSGLLLPQVAYEYSWGPEEFLNQVCWKAGLEPTMWMDGASRVYTFEAQIFAEEKPGGSVTEHKLKS